MIGFFPTPYTDELLYSILCRYHKHSGYLTFRASAIDLYGKCTVIPDKEFLNHFTDDALFHICSNQTIENIILQRTMFPIYSAFIEQEKKQTAFNMLKSMTGNWHNILSIPHIGKRFLRYCPICAKEDREHYGETYWHREPQIPFVNICTKHNCFLINTTIQLGTRQPPNFYDAETYIPIHIV